MARVYIDNQPFDVRSNQSMLEACLSLGFNLPYFCWHPALGSVGACRQCAVKQFKNEQDEKGSLVMSCMTPAAEGTRVSIENPEAVAFRASVIEGLMLNHPHDCPVCDEGGECHLQDMTVMTGHDYRRYQFTKRTFQNQDLGPMVEQEMNRCIQCYRCVRFYREYAGGRDFDSYGSRNTVFFGRQKDGVLESEFAGNLVEVCPTGVFTDKTLKRHYTRKWDLQMAPSICAHCGLGCNTTAGERYGTLRRIVNRYNSQVNGYFLCDRGRYGYEFVNSAQRIREPLLRRDGKLLPATREAALERVREIWAGNGSVIGIGSPRASLEANFALRALVGTDRFYVGLAESQLKLVRAMVEILKSGPARSPSLQDIERSDAVLVLGEDVTNTAPRVALALRQAVLQQPLEAAENARIPLWLDHAAREFIQDKKGPLFIAAMGATRLDDVATATYRAAPGDLAQLGFAIAHALDPQAPAAAGLSPEQEALAQRIAQALKSAKRPLVVSGFSCNSLAVIQAAANVAWALCEGRKAAGLSFTTAECNTFGVGLLGGKPLDSAFEAVEGQKVDAAIILENDLFRRESPDLVTNLLKGLKHVIVLDQVNTQTTAEAEVVLPAGTFAESDGTLVSSEGRAQRFFTVFAPRESVQESWRWVRDMMLAVGRREAAAWQNLDHIVSALDAEPALAGVAAAAPPSTFRIAGARIPRQTHRHSGRTAELVQISVHEPKPPQDADSPLAFSMEGSPDQAPGAVTPFFWSPGWNSIQSEMKFESEINGPLRGGDPGVRLLEPRNTLQATYFNAWSPAAKSPQGEWLVVPLYHIFGSEELSRLAPAVAELTPKPYLALNPEDLKALQLTPGNEVELKIAGSACRLAVETRPDLPRGVAGLPAGLTSMGGTILPAWGRIARAL
jgi:NADH-quinone oxidoreductase subunit G